MKTLAVSVLVLVGTMVASQPVFAGNGNIAKFASASYIPWWTQAQYPGITWTFATSGISSGGDTVIHVQNFDDPQGGFIAGDDDGNGFPASRVVVPPAATARALVIIVRAFGASSSGTCTVTATPSSGTPYSFTTSFAGVPLFPTVGDLVAGSHVTTAEIPGGTDDTVLLAVSGVDSTHAVGFDDDDGVGAMSWIHLNEACPSCNLIVGTYYDAGIQTTNAIWDADADTLDSDGDHLGDGLEQNIHTNWATDPTHKNQDTDQDGIPDNEELLGIEPASGPPIRYPLMGADPLKKDLFVEVDWLQCTGMGCDPMLGIDTYKMQEADALAYAADFSPDVQVHLDIGTVNLKPESRTIWNYWGGAESGTSNSSPCNGFTPNRVQRFHHMLAQPFIGKAGGGDCLWASRAERSAVHETGHNFFLLHGGRPLAISSVNDKIHQPSIMNYGYQGDKADAFSFSRGVSPVFSLNPSALTERMTAPAVFSAAILNLLAPGSGSDWAGAYKVDTTNGHAWVDWDRDGEFAVGNTTRAAINVTPGRLADGQIGTHGGSDLSTSGVFTGMSMVWQKGVGGSIGDRLLLVGVNAANNVVYKSALKTTLNAANNVMTGAGCGSFTSLAESWPNCAGLNTSSNTAGPAAGTTNFGAAVVALGNNSVMFIIADSTNKLRSFTLTTSGTGVDTWSPTPLVLPGNVAISGDPAALSTLPGAAAVWAPSGGRLKRWTFAAGAWAAPTDELWADGSFVAPQLGIGLTVGYQDGSASSSVYGVIPTAPNSLVEFAQRSNSTGRWSKNSTIWQATGQPTALGRPGLAYVPPGGGLPVYSGRFYTMINQPNWFTVVTMTEGNMTPDVNHTTKRLMWNVATAVNPTPTLTATPLMFDSTVDSNLRAAIGFGALGSYFFPLADGIINANVTDLNDWAYITGAERASLGLETLPLP